MIEITDLKLTHIVDQRVLIDGLDLIINDHDKVAIIGEEGNGKSSLLLAILDPSLIERYIDVKGKINIHRHKLGYLPQTLDEKTKDLTAFEYFSMIDDLYEISPKIIKKYAKELMIDDDLIYSDRRLSTFSGGELIKLELLHIFLLEADVLLLDEPSNDLDLKTLDFLENFIKNTDKTVIFISHDERLLEACANKIVHIESLRRKVKARATVYKGRYSDYINERRRSFDIQDKHADKERSELAKKEARYRKIHDALEYDLRTVSRQDPHTGFLLKKKMHATKALEKRLDKQKQDLTAYHEEEEAIMLGFKKVKVPNFKKIIDFKLDELKIGDKLLASNIKLEIYGPKKVAIIGQNGAGKSTLLHIIKDMLADRASYMPQNYDEKMDEDIDVVHFIKKDPTKDEYSEIRTMLGSLKYKDDEMLHKISSLSGGQKAKLYFLKMIYERKDILLLDEPTRNLSPLSSPVIRSVLKDYDGAIIMVTHDRSLLEEVADEIYELDQDGLHKR